MPDAVRRRIHLASIPMDDVDENAIIINALQRHAYLVVQKSLVEGFGLTVTEAMWKARPVIASRVGGIQDQIVDERDGLLIADPSDLDAVADDDGPAVGRPSSSPTDSVPPGGRASTTSSSATGTSPSTSSCSSGSAPDRAQIARGASAGVAVCIPTSMARSMNTSRMSAR